MSRVRIGDIARIRRGASPRPIADPKWFADSGPGWVRIGDVTRGGKYLRATEQRLSEVGVQRSVRVKPGDVIMSVAASVGVTAIVDMDACIHDGWVVLSEFEELADREFLYYLLAHHAPAISAIGQTGSQNNINSDILRDWEVELPPLDLQRRHSTVLATADRLVAECDAVMEAKRAMKRGLMQGLLTGRGRFPEFGKPSASGDQAPGDWTVTTLGEIAEIRVSNVNKHTSPHEAAIRLCNYMDVFRHPYITDDLAFMRATAAPAEIERFRLLPNDVLLTKDSETREEIAEPSVVLEVSEDVVLGYHVALARPNEKRVDGRFVAAQLRLPMFRRHFVRAAQGATRFGLTLDVLRSAPVWLPELTEQRRIADFDLATHRELELLGSMRAAYEHQKRVLMRRLLASASAARESESVNLEPAHA